MVGPGLGRGGFVFASINPPNGFKIADFPVFIGTFTVNRVQLLGNSRRILIETLSCVVGVSAHPPWDMPRITLPFAHQRSLS